MIFSILFTVGFDTLHALHTSSFVRSFAVITTITAHATAVGVLETSSGTVCAVRRCFLAWAPRRLLCSSERPQRQFISLLTTSDASTVCETAATRVGWSFTIW